jgi:hypothetical protein
MLAASQVRGRHRIPVIARLRSVTLHGQARAIQELASVLPARAPLTAR